MQGSEIAALLAADTCTAPLFQGVFAADTLPRNVQGPAVLVVNTDPAHFEGSHWVAICINSFGRGEFFDSLGLPPIVPHHRRFMESNCSSWTSNNVRVQGVDSALCGEYCIMYLTQRARGISMEEFMWSFSDTNHVRNDELLHKQFTRKFSRHTSKTGGTLFGIQCCRSNRESGLLGPQHYDV